jgi:hypothetical protein
MCSTAKTVEEAFFVIDREGRRFLLMKRAQGMELTPRPAQWYSLTHHLRHPDTVAYFFNKRLRKLHNVIEWVARLPVDKNIFSRNAMSTIDPVPWLFLC